MLFQWLQRSYSLPGTPKQDFSWISWNFMKFREISWDFMKFLKFYPNSGFAGSLECQALQPLLFPKEYQGFVKGCGWLRTQKLMIFINNHWTSGIFMKFHKFPPISPVFGPAVLARKKDSNSYAFSMVAALMFPPRAPQNMFSWKYWFQTKILGIFMKICEI